MMPAQNAMRSLVTNGIHKPRAPMKGREAIEQMADDIRVVAARSGGVTKDDLKLIGWTPAQIETHADAARGKAQDLAGGHL